MIFKLVIKITFTSILKLPTLDNKFMFLEILRKSGIWCIFVVKQVVRKSKSVFDHQTSGRCDIDASLAVIVRVGV